MKKNFQVVFNAINQCDDFVNSEASCQDKLDGLAELLALFQVSKAWFNNFYKFLIVKDYVFFMEWNEYKLFPKNLSQYMDDIVTIFVQILLSIILYYKILN